MNSGGIRHPLDRNALYEPDGHGGVLVTTLAAWGRFRRDGEHVEGPLFEADPELCLWVGTPRPGGHHRLGGVHDAPHPDEP